MITASDNGWVRTHDEAETLLRYSALGATVVYDPLRRSKNKEAIQRTREFSIVLDSAPSHAINHLDMYTLPVRASHLTSRVVALCNNAVESLRKHRATINER
jgi:hypothetical protein